MCVAAYRIFMRLSSKNLTEWDLATAIDELFVDTAAPRKSARLEASRRAHRAEVAHWTNMYYLQLSWDLAKFYDSIEVENLLEEAHASEFPAEQLV